MAVTAGFADHLIRELDAEAGVTETVSFDRDAVKAGLFRRPS